MRDYREYNDYELLYMVNESDEVAYNLLYDKYKPLIISTAKKYSSIYNNYGIDINDFILEGYIALENCIKRHHIYNDFEFQKLVLICINRSMQNLVRKARLKKYSSLNNSLYYEDLEINNDVNYLEIKEDKNAINPEQEVIFKETKEEIYKKYTSILRGIEKEVFILKFNGLTNDEISKKLNKSTKSITNALNRIKDKQNSLIEKY